MGFDSTIDGLSGLIAPGPNELRHQKALRDALERQQLRLYADMERRGMLGSRYAEQQNQRLRDSARACGLMDAPLPPTFSGSEQAILEQQMGSLAPLDPPEENIVIVRSDLIVVDGGPLDVPDPPIFAGLGGFLEGLGAELRRTLWGDWAPWFWVCVGFAIGLIQWFST